MLTFACCLLHNVHAVRLTVSQCKNFLGGGQKLANRFQPFLNQSSPTFEGIQRSFCRLTSFFPIVDIIVHCRDTFGQILKSVIKSGFLSQPVGCTCPGSLDLICQIAVISEYVSSLVEIRSVTSEIRRQKKENGRKKERKKPHGKI